MLFFPVSAGVAQDAARHCISQKIRAGIGRGETIPSSDPAEWKTARWTLKTLASGRAHGIWAMWNEGLTL